MRRHDFAGSSPELARVGRSQGRGVASDCSRKNPDLPFGASFDAFGREEQHAYEFQLGGKGPMDPEARCYVLPGAFEHRVGDGKPPAGRVDLATLNSLGLKEGDAFGYWFDFGDDWWHQINVAAVEEKVPRGKYPRVTKRVGKSPPQYADLDEDE